MLGDEVGMSAQAVARAFDLHDDGVMRLCCINQLRDEFSLTLSELTFSKQPRFWGFQAR